MKPTRYQINKEKEIIKILEDNGFEIKRQGMTSTRFYYSRILEAARK